jgi:predicted nucleic acid-binding protein
VVNDIVGSTDNAWLELPNRLSVGDELQPVCAFIEKNSPARFSRPEGPDGDLDEPIRDLQVGNRPRRAAHLVLAPIEAERAIVGSGETGTLEKKLCQERTPPSLAYPGLPNSHSENIFHGPPATQCLVDPGRGTCCAAKSFEVHRHHGALEAGPHGFSQLALETPYIVRGQRLELLIGNPGARRRDGDSPQLYAVSVEGWDEQIRARWGVSVHDQVHGRPPDRVRHPARDHTFGPHASMHELRLMTRDNDQAFGAVAGFGTCLAPKIAQREPADRHAARIQPRAVGPGGCDAWRRLGINEDFSVPGWGL